MISLSINKLLVEINLAKYILVILTLFRFTHPCISAEIKLEAENASLTGVTKSTSYTGYSGTGYISGFDNSTDKITFTFNATSGLYDLFIGFCTPNGEKGYDMVVNGSSSTGMFPASNTFKEANAGKVLLNEGQNVIIIGNGWGWFYIDYIRLVPTITYAPLKPSQGLTDTLATQSAKDLYNWLSGLYGQKVLSGQCGLEDLQYVKTVTGHTPVVAGFDLIEYSPSRIEYGSNPTGQVESWINWEHEKGCIINLMWHWNAPTDLINLPEKEWWRGFYTIATTFDIAAVLADTTSAKYDLLIRDMDSIAHQLKKFADEDIPVLWRPLHEASGGWFWWGAKGPAPFIHLWRLMYDRMVNYHQLHNLIWVYTSGDSEWYPGDDVVDIVSLDIYTSAGSSMSAEWENIQAEFNGKKIVALSESGTLPVADKIRLFSTWWSWFAVWQGDYIRNANQSDLIAIYNDNDILTMEKIGNWRTYSSFKNNYKDRLYNNELKAFYNPASASVFVSFDFQHDSNYTIKVYNMQGTCYYRMLYNPSQINSHYIEIPVEHFSNGIYIVTVNNGNSQVSCKLLLAR
jgi:mannan endo-1,4-beta-mannosidase